MKKIIIYAGTVLSIVFLWLALRDTQWDEMANAFSKARLWPIIPMYGCLAGFYVLKAMRWSVLLSPSHTVSTRKLIPAMMVGAASNNLLPAHIGEIIRVYYAGSELKIPKSTVLATLVLERVLDIIAILSILSVTFLFGGGSRALVGAGSLLLAIGLGVGFICFALVRYHHQVIVLSNKLLRFVSDALRQKVANQIVHVGDGLASLREGNLYWGLWLNSTVQWLLMAGCVYCAILALQLDVSPLVAVVILGIIVAGLTLPTSPGFFGTIEYCFVLGLATVGVDASTALSTAIYYHIPIWLAVTLSGLLIVHLNRKSFRQLRDDASQI